ncbi:MAG: hypothetical protein QM758_13590 [Armatimonas sp.]
MKRILISLALALIAAVPGFAQVVFTSPVTINANDTTYENQDIIVRGTTVTINGSHAFTSLRVENNGIVTHSAKSEANFSNGMNLSVAGDCSIDFGSAIDATGKGWPASEGPGAGINSVSEGGGGAAYGGEGTYIGGTSGEIYGNIKSLANLGNYENLGSGGGSGYTGTYSGSAGGGAIRMTVSGILSVNGAILSQGANSPANGGAGSGGSISIDVNQLVGGGSLVAHGGYGNNHGGGGGGGRIAVTYTDKAAFTGNVQALGNRSNDFGTRAGAGTVLLKQRSQENGDLIIDNAGNNGFSTILSYEETYDNVLIKNFGILSPRYGQVLKLDVVHNLVVETAGRINADGRGHGASSGPGRGLNNNSQGGGGASYGGEGSVIIGLPNVGTVSRTSGTPYGNLRDPNAVEDGTHLGSGGGSGYAGTVFGSPGGGALRLNVGETLQNEGIISANGLNSPGSGGAGSGGSIYLNVGSLSGSGFVSVNGGYGNNQGGGGSGGRISVYYRMTVNASMLQAFGNRSNDFGTRSGAGTIFLKSETQPHGDLIVNNNTFMEFPTTLSNAVDPEGLVFDNITVESGGYIAPPALTALNLFVTGDLNIKGGGRVGAIGRGYDPGQGPGAGQGSASDRGAGASYGGRGGSWAGANSGLTYGDADLPVDFGSGGGFAYNDPNSQAGSYGGGAVRLTVNGTLRNEGQINVGPSYRYGYGGGGSGGSVLLRVGSLAGNGVIYAQGDGGVDGIGYGGGGRVSIYYVSSASWTGAINVNGGNGASEANGGNGTIRTQQTSGNLMPSLSISPTTLGSEQASVGSVTLSGPAPEGGLTLSLSNSDPSAVTIPTSVTIPEGATSATFPITAGNVSLQRQATIAVRLWDQTSSQVVTVKPWVAAVRFNPSSARTGQAVAVTVTLNLPAPASGLALALSSSDSVALPVPVSITIPGGGLSGTVNTTAGSVSAAKQVTVSATVSGATTSGSVWINPGTAQVSSLAVSPASVLGGSRVFGVVVLTAPAPTGGAIVALTSAVSSGTNPTTVPTSVTVPAGKTSASFPITTRAVATPTTVLITGTLGVSKNATLVVTIPTVVDLQLIPSSVRGTETSIGIVTLSGASPTPVTVTVTSNNGAAIPEASFVIPAGQTNGTFVIDTTVVGSTTTATITAKANGIGKSQLLTITP